MDHLIDINEALDWNREQMVSHYKDHLNPALARLLGLLNFDKQYVRASGTEVWDSQGNKYLDFLGGYGALNFGHNPPELLEAIQQASQMPNLLQASINTLASAAATNLSRLAPGELSHVFFGNSGAEAVEGALKLARAASSKHRILYCAGSFHGKSLGALSVTGREKYQKPFQPLLPGVDMIPFGEVKSLEMELKKGDVAAFIVEPIQGEGGIITPPQGYLTRVRELCNQHNCLLILDEIQSGLGRTGHDFACQAEGVVPDIMCLAKSLGGGVIPVGAFITTEDIWNQAYGTTDKAMLHTSTFGGNSLASAAALTALKLLKDRELSRQAADKGRYFLDKLQELAENYQLIKEVRGQGLMIGIEFNQPKSGILDKISQGKLSQMASEYMGAMIAGTLQNDFQIITAYTLNNPNVIRLEPPLIVDYEELDYVVESLEKIFEENSGFLDVTMNSARSMISGWFN